MANGFFKVKNGLQVGPLTINATTGAITSSGTGQNLTSVLTVSPDDTATQFETDAGLTDQLIVATSNVDAFTQLAISNRSDGGSASADFIAYADTGDNTQGYVDMGIASSQFDDPAYGITFAGDSYIFASAPAGTGGNLVLATENGTVGDIVFAAGGFTSGTEQGRFVLGDGLSVTGNLISEGGTLFQGPLAKELLVDDSMMAGYVGITNPTGVFTGNVNAFIQMALHNNNNGGSASSDYIAYSDTGDNLSGYIDMGITSTNFDDPAFGITKQGDGYIFVSAPKFAGNSNPTGGNLVIATSDGAYGDIVFAAGGFFDGTEQGRFVLDDGFLVKGNVVAENGAFYQGKNAAGTITARDLTIDEHRHDITEEVYSLSHSGTTVTLTWKNADSGFNLLSAQIGELIEIEEYSGSDDTALNYYHAITGVNTGARTVTFTVPGITGSGTYTLGSAVVLLYQDGARVGLTDASGIFTGDADSFVQFALKNHSNGTSASTDMICYASNGSNESGWIDMGITSENFADTTYGVTGPSDGYIFMKAPQTGVGAGQLFISTAETGTKNDIVFSTDGFDSGNERMRIVGKDRVDKKAGVEIYIETASTSSSTGALRVNGGIGLLGNLNVGGNFNLVGNITIGGTGSTTSTSTLVIENPMNFLANSNPSNNQDIGMVGQYVSGSTKYTGIVRQASTGSWRVFDGLGTVPTTTVSWNDVVNADLITGSANIANVTSASSTTTGALKVAGGVGIAKSMYIGGDGTTAITHTGHIIPSANLSYNLGSSTAWYGTYYGISTQAKYADLAENYQADSNYQYGTVLMFGGDKEVTIATADTKAVAGVVSQNPAHLMNGALGGQNVVPLALQGRVPCNVVGPIKKGDLLVSAGFGYAKANNNAQVGQVIGKALSDFPGAKGQIEVVVGRF
jgi:hypothetical protein